MGRHFLLIGDVGGAETYHVGDEGMLEANLTALRQLDSKARFTVISQDPAWTAATYDVEAIEPLGFPDRTVSPAIAEQRLDAILKAAEGGTLPRGLERRSAVSTVIEQVGAADAVIVSGGGNLNDSWPQHLYERVALLELAALFETPAVVLGQTVGPRLTDPLRQRLQAAARGVRLFGLRESTSYDLMTALGMPEETLHRQLDDAFFLGRDSKPSTTERGPQGPYLAVTLCGDVEDLTALAEPIERLAVETGTEIVFIPHAGEPDGDRELGERFAAALRGEVSFHLLDLPMASEAAALTRSARMVVSMRYHPLVFAVSAGVPALAISVDDYTRSKQRGALAHAGMEGWTLPLEFAGAGLLYPAARELWERGDEIRAHLEELLPIWENQFQEHWQRVGRTLGLAETKQPEPGVESAGEVAELSPQGEWYAALRAAQRVTAALESKLSEVKKHSEELRQVVEARESEIAEQRALLGDGRKQMDSLKQELESQGKILQAREKEIEDLHTAGEAGSKELEYLRPTLAARQTEVESLAIELAARDEVLAGVRRELAAIQEVLTARDDEIANLRPTLAARQEEIDSLRALLASREESIDGAQRELAATREILTARDEEISALKSTLAARSEETGSLESTLAARDEELASIKPILAARDEELASIKPILAARDEELNELGAILDARKEELDEARQELARVQSRLLWRESQLDAYRRSLPGKLARGLGLVTDEDS